jgi:hypothetical protein
MPKAVIDVQGALAKLGPHLPATWQVTTHEDQRVIALAFRVGEQESALLLQPADAVQVIVALSSAVAKLVADAPGGAPPGERS